MLDLELEILCLLGTGIWIEKKGMLSAQTVSQLTDFVVDIVLPCAIVSSFEMKLTSEILVSTSQVFVIAIGMQGLYCILNRFLYRTWGNGEQICAKYATMVTNASFIGMPIAQSLYGATGLLFASISVLPQRVLMWSYGLSLYTNQKQDVDWRKILFHPCVVSIFIGIGVMAAYGAGFVLPEGVSKTLSMVGSCSTPLCLVIIGTIVGRLDWNDLFPWRGFLFSVYRVLFPPAMALLLVWCLLVNTLAKQISILLAAMSTTVILAEKYQKNPKFASQLMVLSTFLSFVSIPLFTFVLQWI